VPDKASREIGIASQGLVVSALRAIGKFGHGGARGSEDGHRVTHIVQAQRAGQGNSIKGGTTERISESSSENDDRATIGKNGAGEEDVSRSDPKLRRTAVVDLPSTKIEISPADIDDLHELIL
jgi:hypothetical protein